MPRRPARAVHGRQASHGARRAGGGRRRRSERRASDRRAQRGARPATRVRTSHGAPERVAAASEAERGRCRALFEMVKRTSRPLPQPAGALRSAATSVRFAGRDQRRAGVARRSRSNGTHQAAVAGDGSRAPLALTARVRNRCGPSPTANARPLRHGFQAAPSRRHWNHVRPFGKARRCRRGTRLRGRGAVLRLSPAASSPAAAPIGSGGVTSGPVNCRNVGTAGSRRSRAGLRQAQEGVGGGAVAAIGGADRRPSGGAVRRSSGTARDGRTQPHWRVDPRVGERLEEGDERVSCRAVRIESLDVGVEVRAVRLGGSRRRGCRSRRPGGASRRRRCGSTARVSATLRSERRLEGAVDRGAARRALPTACWTSGLPNGIAAADADVLVRRADADVVEAAVVRGRPAPSPIAIVLDRLPTHVRTEATVNSAPPWQPRTPCPVLEELQALLLERRQRGVCHRPGSDRPATGPRPASLVLHHGEAEEEREVVRAEHPYSLASSGAAWRLTDGRARSRTTRTISPSSTTPA